MDFINALAMKYATNLFLLSVGAVWASQTPEPTRVLETPRAPRKRHLDRSKDVASGVRRKLPFNDDDLELVLKTPERVHQPVVPWAPQKQVLAEYEEGDEQHKKKVTVFEDGVQTFEHDEDKGENYYSSSDRYTYQTLVDADPEHLKNIKQFLDEKFERVA